MPKISPPSKNSATRRKSEAKKKEGETKQGWKIQEMSPSSRPLASLASRALRSTTTTACRLTTTTSRCYYTTTERRNIRGKPSKEEPSFSLARCIFSGSHQEQHRRQQQKSLLSRQIRWKSDNNNGRSDDDKVGVPELRTVGFEEVGYYYYLSMGDHLRLHMQQTLLPSFLCNNHDNLDQCHVAITPTTVIIIIIIKIITSPHRCSRTSRTLRHGHHPRCSIRTVSFAARRALPYSRWVRNQIWVSEARRCCYGWWARATAAAAAPGCRLLLQGWGPCSFCSTARHPGWLRSAEGLCLWRKLVGLGRSRGEGREVGRRSGIIIRIILYLMIDSDSQSK